MKNTKFATTILTFGNNTGIEVPQDNLKELGTSKKPPVMVKIGDYEYSSSIAVMNGKYMISLSKAHRESAGLKGGDKVEVSLTLIEGKREVVLPEVLIDFLDEHNLRDRFDALAYSIRKELVRKIVDAKKSETQIKRLNEIKATLT